MNYKPLGSRVLIRIITKTQVQVGGQTLTIARGVNKYGQAKKEWEEELLTAEIVKVGDNVSDVTPGDVVLIMGYAGKWVDGDIVGSGETHRIADESDILAIDLEATEKLKTKEAIHA